MSTSFKTTTDERPLFLAEHFQQTLIRHRSRGRQLALLAHQQAIKTHELAKQEEQEATKEESDHLFDFNESEDEITETPSVSKEHKRLSSMFEPEDLLPKYKSANNHIMFLMMLEVH